MGLPYLDRGDTKTVKYFSDEDNEKCIRLISEWQPTRLQDLKRAEEEGVERGTIVPMSVPVPEFVAYKIMEICRNAAKRHNYCAYTYREDMVAEAVANAIRYLHTFDTSKVGERSQKVNFYGWVTKTLDGVFGGIITSEKKHEYRKNVSLLYSPLSHGLLQEADNADTVHHDSDSSFGAEAVGNSPPLSQKIYNDFIGRAAEFENTMEKRAERSKERAAKKAAKKNEGKEPPPQTNVLF